MNLSLINKIINNFKDSSIKYLEDLALDLEKFSTQKLDFQNLKIKYIKTNENRQVDNPAHEIDFDKKNYFILGEMGTGKTTFFDKIYHTFTSRDEIYSPIQNYITDIEIILENKKNEYSLVFKTSTVEPKKTSIYLNDYNQESSLELLEQLGLTYSYINQILFISQLPKDDKLFEDLTNIKDFTLFSEFFYDPIEKQLNSILNKKITDLNKVKLELLNERTHFENILIDLTSEIKEYKSILTNINDFIKNFDNIKIKIEELKNNIELRDKLSKKREINNKISDLEAKIEKVNNLKELEKKTKISSKDRYKELYIEYNPVCPICSDLISLKEFQKRYNKDLCFLCGDSRYSYSDSKKTPDYDNSEIFYSDIYLNYDKKLKILNEEKINVEKEIQNIRLESKKAIPEKLIEIMSNFYIDINRPGFSLDEELNRQINLKENYENLIIQKEEEIKKFKHRIDTSLEHEKIIEKALDIMIINYELLQNELKKETDKFFMNFIKDIQNYWQKISKEKKKNIEYLPIEKCLSVVTVSKNAKTRVTKIRTIKPRKKQRRLSNSQLNALRYSIHFSLLKNLLEKYENLPIRSMLIDDPDSECRETLLNFLEKDFLSAYNFQAIIFVTESEEVKKRINDFWYYREFKKNEELENIGSKSYQMSLDLYLKSRKIENQSENEVNQKDELNL